MRTYVKLTGTVFGLLLLLHLARVAAEGLGTLRDPFFVLSTLVAAGLCFWAVQLLGRADDAA